LDKIRLRILNNPAQRFPQTPFLFARLLFDFAKNSSEGDGLFLNFSFDLMLKK